MSWFNVWDGLKNKTCRYLLQRYLGQFLEEKLNLEQLKIELYSGKATVKNVSLNIAALNDLCAAQGWALEVVSGYIGEINVTVPWNALMTKDSFIEVSDLNISVRPIKRENTGSSMLESMWSSASSSIQMAEECMKQKDDSIEDPEAISSAIIGLEKFAETIDNVLNRINAHFIKTVLNLEYLCNDGSTVISLVTTIDDIIYKNETGCEKSDENIARSDSFTECSNFVPSFAKHKVKLNGIQMYTNESTENSYGYNRMQNIKTSCGEFVKKNRILIMEIFDEQKVELKMKQSEEVSGPKIFLSVELGSMYTLLNPRQMHLLFKLIGAFYDDPIKSTGDHICTSKGKSENKAHLFGEHVTSMTGILSNNINWNNDFEDEDNSFNTEKSEKRRGLHCESLTSSMSSSSTITNTKRYQHTLPNTDSCVHILDFTAKVNSYVGVFLYEDEVTSNLNSNNIKQKITIFKLATNYFNQLKYVDRDQNEDMSLLNDINHVSLRLKPVFMNGIQQRNKNILLLKCLLTAAKIDLCEVLQRSVSPLLCFHRFEDSCDDIKVKPEMTIQFSSTSSCNLKDEVTSSIEIKLEKCVVECDISIYDRLSAYICQSPFENTFQITRQKDINDLQEAILISILCRELDIKLRFPIVDMKPAQDRIPWWKQYIRPDFLLISMRNIFIEYKMHLIDINSTEINAYYCESDISTKLRLFTAQNNDLSCKENKEPNIPKIAIHLHQFKSFDSVNCIEKSGLNHPFSSRKECRHSDTVHSVDDTQDNFEHFVLPGEREEVKKFCYTAVKDSYVSVHINLPIARGYLESKCVYELLYNRINSDLLLWEPSSPYHTESKIPQNNITESLLNESYVDSIYIPHTQSKVIHDKLDYEMDNHRNSSRSLYFSSHESCTNGRTNKKIELKNNQFSLEIVIEEGSLTLLVPVRDSLSNVLPGQLGKFDFMVRGLNICSVSGFHGNEDLGYVCIQLKNIEVYHCGLVPVNVHNLIRTGIEEYMQATFYATPENLTKGNKNGIKEREMMSVVIEIKKNPKQRVKRLKLTLGVQKTTLRHYPALSSHVWLNQLIDFFDVLDFPIEGFLPYGVITEIQLKLWDCAIDYRPKCLEYRSIIEIGSFSMSSNIISSVSGCNLRFALEDCVLSIAPFDCMKNIYPESKVSFIPSDSLVPVIEIGLLDISLRLKDDYSPKHPKMDLRFSVHDFHLRTCYDSFCGLSQLITHIGNDGDVSIQDDFDLFGSNINLFTSTNSELFCSKSKLNDSEMERKQQERINVLMAEAVQEIGASQNTSSQESINKFKEGIEVFYFPDESSKNDPNVGDNSLNRNEYCDILNFESNVMLNSYYSKSDVDDTLPQVKQDLGDIYNKLDDEQNALNEEGFCMVSENVQKNIGIKNVEITDDPLRIVDNHFCLPNAKTDLLKTPDNFPMPVIRYTLCEMTFTWHIYGGNDFPEGNNKADKSVKKYREYPKMSEAYKNGVSYSKCSKNIQFGKKPKDKLTWKTIGGPQRNHEIVVEMQFTKIRVSHEQYPVHTSHASRQVILISDIEIRDRLQISDIKKFLYHPNFKSAINKNSHDMIVVKALHVRPNQNLCNEQECSLRISVLPLRLNIDQNTLIFLSDFFANINEKSNSHNVGYENNKVNIETEYIEEPVMTMESSEDLQYILPQKVVSTNLDLLMNDRKEDVKEKAYENKSKNYSTVQPSPIYFREVVFSPDLPVCFDYHGHKIEFSRGPIVGLLMGLGQLECSEIRLKKIAHRRGILGIDKLIKFLCKEWLTDIKKNQLSKILKGVGPTKAFKQLFDGIYDLFRLPFEQYQKDGRIIRGLQLGAQSFTARTALAALEITARVIQLLQFTAETAFDMVSPGPSVRQKRKSTRGKKRRSNRPKDIREGVTNAYIIVKEGINDSANNLIETAVSEHDQKGYAGAVGAVMRQIPQLVVCPAVLATQATNNILGGVKSSLVPEAKVEAREKWKDDSD